MASPRERGDEHGAQILAAEAPYVAGVCGLPFTVKLTVILCDIP